ncbi:MAG: hypothetical protein CVU46_01845 [Chloroflexi bacterium HGW-Chloroflexi-8]|nr:MAG: hypothetical protein CVU46_01845 [Chloroflexi bacterium HGW-Chloroflexi-8]
MKKINIVLIFVMLVGILSACSAGSSKGDMTRTISVSGTGEVYLVPDIAYVYVGTRSQAADVGTALSDNNKQAQSISTVLSGLGLDPKDIQTIAFNVYPMQNYDQNGQPLEMQYVVENTVYVKVRDLAKLGEMLDAVVKGGANQINGISFDVQDRKTAETEARRLAIENAKERATEIANAAGVELGELMNINVNSSGTVTPMYDAKGGGYSANMSSTPIASGQLLITADAFLSYGIK